MEQVSTPNHNSLQYCNSVPNITKRSYTYVHKDRRIRVYISQCIYMERLDEKTSTKYVSLYIFMYICAYAIIQLSKISEI